uniref:Uncharacterized protein n=1 Tax=Romanomermis culicivorax TaxID=13658 RepID=A0A915IYH6_ROMCU
MIKRPINNLTFIGVCEFSNNFSILFMQIVAIKIEMMQLWAAQRNNHFRRLFKSSLPSFRASVPFYLTNCGPKIARLSRLLEFPKNILKGTATFTNKFPDVRWHCVMMTENMEQSTRQRPVASDIESLIFRVEKYVQRDNNEPIIKQIVIIEFLKMK